MEYEIIKTVDLTKTYKVGEIAVPALKSVNITINKGEFVAIARALVNNPSIILADEPTGNLDSTTSVEVFCLFQKLNEEGITIVMVTHERDYAAFAKRIIEMRDGRKVKDVLIKERLNAQIELERIKAKTIGIEV